MSTPREQAREITQGKKEPHFIGTKSNGVLQQEFYQSMINWNPNLLQKEKDRYMSNLKNICSELKQRKILDQIFQKYNKNMDKEFRLLVKLLL